MLYLINAQGKEGKSKRGGGEVLQLNLFWNCSDVKHCMPGLMACILLASRVSYSDQMVLSAFRTPAFWSEFGRAQYISILFLCWLMLGVPQQTHKLVLVCRSFLCMGYTEVFFTCSNVCRLVMRRMPCSSNLYKSYQSFVLRLTLPFLFLAATSMCEKIKVCVVWRGNMRQLHLEKANTTAN